MAITTCISRVQEDLRRGRFSSEAAVSQGILLPVLQELGWPVFDTSIVIPEFGLQGRRVDYALCHPAGRPCVFVEVKQVGLSEGADRQLFEYAFHEGVPMAILTDGQGWSFYLPGEQGPYEERRVYKLDLLERTTEEAGERLERYLGYDNVRTGAALKSARSDYRDVARNRVIVSNLPTAWVTLLQEQDSQLLDSLADKVEVLCGYRPDPDTCGKFLEQLLLHQGSIPAPGPGTTSPPDRLAVVFRGKRYPARSAREAMTKLFQLLAKDDSGFLERFASRRHGRRRRYLARDRRELYPGRPDLAEQHSVEVVPGWWLGVNYSRKNIQEIIDLALEVAGPQVKAAVQVKVD